MTRTHYIYHTIVIKIIRMHLSIIDDFQNKPAGMGIRYKQWFETLHSILGKGYTHESTKIKVYHIKMNHAVFILIVAHIS